MKDWLTEWYNDQFNKIDLTPSSSVWENISQTMEDWPKHWYSSNVTDLGTKPRPSTWEQVHASLAHDRKVQLANRLSYTAASVILFFLLIIPFKVKDSFLTVDHLHIANNKKADGFTLDFNQSNADISSRNSEEPIQPQTSNSTKVVSTQNQFGTNETREELIGVPNELQSIDLSFDETIKNQSLIVASDFEINSLPVLIADLKQNVQSSEINTARRTSQKGNWISLGVAPQLSLLNNPVFQKTINSDAESIQWKPSMTYVLSAGHKFNNQNGIKVAMLFNNKKTLETTSNKAERSIALNYFSVGALYTSTWQIGQSRRFRLNTEAGLFAGVLINKDAFLNNERIKYLEEGYGKLDAGVILGASISTRLSDEWSLTTGLSSQVGMLNTFRGTEVIPPGYFRTTTQSLSLNIGAVYKL